MKAQQRWKLVWRVARLRSQINPTVGSNPIYLSPSDFDVVARSPRMYQRAVSILPTRVWEDETPDEANIRRAFIRAAIEDFRQELVRKSAPLLGEHHHEDRITSAKGKRRANTSLRRGVRVVHSDGTTGRTHHTAPHLRGGLRTGERGQGFGVPGGPLMGGRE